jgi:hypothetical protein
MGTIPRSKPIPQNLSSHPYGETRQKVLQVELSNIYVSKITRPRVKMLIGNIKNLFQKIVIIIETPKNNVVHKHLFNGIPNQCNRCRIHGHLFKGCPLKKLNRKTIKETLLSQPCPHQIGKNLFINFLL